MSALVTYQLRGSIAVVTIDNPPVNAISQKVRAELDAAVTRLSEDTNAVAAVITGAGKVFIGGADISEFGKPPQAPFLTEVLTRLEDCPKPIVAAINGAALGGGLEVALATHGRVAVSSVSLGLPEVTLGVLPGAGGTQRLPRLIGTDAALDIITTGKPVKGDTALALGLMDEVSEQPDLLDAALRLAEKIAQAGAPQATGLRALPAQPANGFDSIRSKVKASAPGQVSALKAIDAVEAATKLGRTEGLAEERRLFLELMETPQRAALIHAFFSERKAAHQPDVAGLMPEPFTEIGVVGGGTMGAGIATAALSAGLTVTLIERDQAAADKAFETISGNLAGAVKRGKLSEEARQSILAEKLTTSTSYDALSTSDILIEAVFESMDVKKQVFAQLDAVAKPGATLATNTSYLDINEIAASTTRPQGVIGLHFFSPAHVMRLLEVVVAEKTSPAHTARAFALAKRLGKIGVRAGVCDGFIGNRILSHYKTATDHMVMDGASPYDIDAAVTALGFAMGPFQVSDLAGIDIGHAARQRRKPFRHALERSADYADRLFENGWLGRKTGRGFYIYDTNSQKGRINPDVLPLIEAERKAAGIKPRHFSMEEIQRRYMAAMINEAARVLTDGIAQRPSDIDVVFLSGYGFPRWRGGPMHFADSQGLAKVLDDIRSFASDDAHFWSVAPLLEELVANGQTFNDLNKASTKDTNS
ncbi:3-hydroxyacyl-CoA dehydrogenase NAD-binding domain-containing protein [Roseibium algae]|uniref:3-hydroxyacyl-CoA dehydrogenase NAD-binding domain-containing protein n=1 Tax=Roseibium algae TaxID=3123038 RepID=A0ABU8TM80_9HYPH